MMKWKLVPTWIQDRLRQATRRHEETHLFKRAKSMGYEPDAIIDVGAYEGDWSEFIHDIYPDTPKHLVEPQHDRITDIDEVYLQNAEVYNTVLSNSSGDTVEFFKHDTGSSYYRENVDVEMDSELRETTRLDDLFSEPTFSRALLKIDAQGAELDILDGTTRILDSISAVYVECSLVEYNKGGVLAEELIAKLRDFGFTPFGVGEVHHQGGQLIQIDLLFVDDEMDMANVWQRELKGMLDGSD